MLCRPPRIGRERIMLSATVGLNLACRMIVQELGHFHTSGLTIRTFCVTPLQPSPVFAADKNENSAGRDIPSLPLDFLRSFVNSGTMNSSRCLPFRRISNKWLKLLMKRILLITPLIMCGDLILLFLNEGPANSATGWNSPSKWPATPKAPKHVGKNRDLLFTDKDIAELSRLLFLEGNIPFCADVVDAEHTISLMPGVATNRVLFSQDRLSGALSRH